MRGSLAVTIKLAETLPMDDAFGGLEGNPGIARFEFWEAADEAGLPVSHEEQLRGGDNKITACLFVETLRENVARKVLDDLSMRLDSMVEEAGIYRLLCELTPEKPS